MKNILIISSHIQEINKFRRFFGTEYKISATNAIDNAMNMLMNKTADLVVYHAGGDYNGVFKFYKKLRKNESTENLPAVIITEPAFVHALKDKVELQKAAVISFDIKQDELIELTETLTA
jgi:PleD family two-component response regulator